MTTLKKVSALIGCLATVACIVLVSCEKKVEGFLSDRIFYQVNPFYIQQGVTAVSSSLIADGSTAPLHVSVLALKDSAENDADSLLTTPRSIVTFTGEVTNADSTLDLLKAKLKDSLVRPFNIAEIGGRLQFTAATTSVPTGTYNIDLAISNVRGTEVLQNACKIVIQPLSSTYNLVYKRLRSIYKDGSSGPLYTTDDADITVDVEHVSGTPTSEIIYKYVDKNGAIFSPSKGEVAAFDPPTRPTLHSWGPYYQEVYRDSTISLQIPDVGLAFPYFSTALLPGGGTFQDGNAIVYYRINNVDLGVDGMYIQACTSLKYLTSGTYYVTVHLNQLTKK